MSAVVRIRPDLESFRSDLTKGVRNASSEAGDSLTSALDDAGRDGGKAAGDGIAAGVKAGTRTARRDVEALEDRAKQMGERFGRLQSFGAKMTLGVTAPLVLAGKSALGTFAALQDAQAAAGVFYGDQAKAIEDFAASSATSFGVSKRAAFELANGLAPLLGQFTAADAMGSRAVEALGRTADMASFFGGSVEEAAGAVQSFLSGSSVEPIRRFGVFASEATVAAKAMELGLVEADVSTAKVTAAQTRLAAAQAKVAKLAREGKQGSLEYQKAQSDVLSSEEALAAAFEGKVPQLTEAQKAEARYALLMEQTSKAQGDFAKTSDSLANSMKSTKAQLEDTAAVTGEKLAPHVIELLGHLNGILDAFNRLPDGTQKLIVMGAAAAAVVGPFASLVGTVGKVSSSLVALAARWIGVKAAADSAAASQGRAALAGSAGGLGRLAIGAGAAGTVSAGTAAVAGAAALAAGYGIGTLLNKELGISDWIANGINGLAQGGTTLTAGTVMVGEHGRELLTLPAGAEVRPLSKASGDTFYINVEVTGRAANDPAALVRELDRLARRASATVGARRLP